MSLPHHFGRYEVIKRLANGGMAEVYLGRYDGAQGFSKRVAIKRILPDEKQDAQFTRMFIDEAKALMHLQHKNIVQVYELGEEGGDFFIAMEYVQGIDLGRLLQAIVQGLVILPPPYAIYIVAQILEALDFAHRVVGDDGKPLGIVHRDISPPNVLCSFVGEVKVADFGIAKGNHRTQQTVVRQLKGKYSYMAPEQVCGANIDHRVDLYATGIILFELLTGERLFEGATDLEVIEKVKKGSIPLDRLEGMPPRLIDLLKTMLDHNPDGRCQSASEFLVALNRIAVEMDSVVCGSTFGDFLRQRFPCDVVSCESRPERATMVATVAEQLQGAVIQPHRSPSLWRFMVGCVAALACCSLPAGAARIGEVSFQPPAVAHNVAPDADASLRRNGGTPNNTGMGYISVSARPWGKVTIPGFVRGHETPVRGIEVPAGRHRVEVVHSPTGKRLAVTAVVGAEARVQCFARFARHPSIQCR